MKKAGEECVARPYYANWGRVRRITEFGYWKFSAEISETARADQRIEADRVTRF